MQNVLPCFKKVKKKLKQFSWMSNEINYLLNGLQNFLKDFNSILILKRAKQILNCSAAYQTKEIICSTDCKTF